MSIGERIIALRKDSNLSQGQLASLLSVSRQAVSKWENDQASPDTMKLIQLAEILSTEVEYLATGRQVTKEPEQIIVKEVEIQEKIVEKPVVKIVEKPVTQFVEKVVEKPVLKKIVRVRYYRNPVEFLIFGIGCFVVGIIVGLLI